MSFEFCIVKIEEKGQKTGRDVCYTQVHSETGVYFGETTVDINQAEIVHDILEGFSKEV